MAVPEGEEDAFAIIKEKEEKRKDELNTGLVEAREELRRKKVEKEKELEVLHAKRDARRKQQAEERKMLEKFEEERKAKAKEEMKKRREVAELKKKEREASLRAMHNPNAYKAIVVEKEEIKPPPKKSDEELAKEKEEAMRDRIQPLAVGANTSEDKVREIAKSLLQRLHNIFSDIFDMKVRRKRQEYDHKELLQRIKDLTKTKEPHSAESAGTVQKFKQGGVFKPKEFSEHESKSRLQKDAEAGSIMSSGGVMGRMGMFGGSTSKKTPGRDGKL